MLSPTVFHVYYKLEKINQLLIFTKHQTACCSSWLCFSIKPSIVTDNITEVVLVAILTNKSFVTSVTNVFWAKIIKLLPSFNLFSVFCSTKALGSCVADGCNFVLDFWQFIKFCSVLLAIYTKSPRYNVSLVKSKFMTSEIVDKAALKFFAYCRTTIFWFLLLKLLQ